MGQGLAGLSLRLKTVQARGIDEKSGQLLRASLGLVSQIQAETRSLVSELREPSQESADIVAALREIIADDGHGFNPEVPRGGGGGHFGCIGIEVRCEELGTSARWQSAPDQGTTIEIELSLEEPAEAIRRGIIKV
ncbi:hypothetical protein [Prosthecobacter sp.]|uniref:hypothetical protein n=1 Tax=Prosthecobacter sp. TaxID=1965333 RepID=UPI002626CC7C|nr:hypothetical protein [Prosthecobacter sp.]